MADTFNEAFDELSIPVNREKKYSRALTTRVSPKRLSAFILTLGRTGNLAEATEAAKIPRNYPDYLAQKSPVFARRMQNAMEKSKDGLETEARRRAVNGWEEPVFGKLPGNDGGSGQIGTIRKYSDKLLETLMRGSRPEKYAHLAQRQNITQVGVKIDLSERLSAAKERIQKIRNS